MDTENTVDRFAAESVVRLADYRAPAWHVTHVELKFELGIDETFVHSKLTLAQDRDEPLRLDGEDVALLAARLDGRALAPPDYAVDVAGLVIHGARDGSVLEMDVRIDPARNSQLCGLYLSGKREHGFLLTQCEAQGSRCCWPAARKPRRANCRTAAISRGSSTRIRSRVTCSRWSRGGSKKSSAPTGPPRGARWRCVSG